MPIPVAPDPYAIIRRLYHFTDVRNLPSIREADRPVRVFAMSRRLNEPDLIPLTRSSVWL